MKYVLLITALFIVGCIPMNSSSEQTDSLKNAQNMQGKILGPTPLISVTGDGKKDINLTITGGLPMTDREITAINKSEMESSLSTMHQVSLGFNVLMFGIGALMIKSLLKGSKSARLTLGLIDNAVSSAISMATHSTDSKDTASASHLRAELESLRRHL